MGLRDISRKTTAGERAGEAATRRNTNIVADEAPDDGAFGLDVWIEGVDPIVEYIWLAALYSLIAANCCLVSSQYMALMVTKKRPGRRRTK